MPLSRTSYRDKDIMDFIVWNKDDEHLVYIKISYRRIVIVLAVEFETIFRTDPPNTLFLSEADSTLMVDQCNNHVSKHIGRTSGSNIHCK